MLSDALSEESSIRKGAGYDETFGLGDESEDFSPSSERERHRPNLSTVRMRVMLRGVRRLVLTK